ncbi:unnamed protein product [Pleuronectes platessa]|uniref:Uncharacterized protein n=1 Tax=Pleuronectes platessa TaxID=8262 RepID=A0A9N7YK41_PLEPL|nr:unnamed protein product [Pleuronectes platessa]
MSDNAGSSSPPTSGIASQCRGRVQWARTGAQVSPVAAGQDKEKFAGRELGEAKNGRVCFAVTVLSTSLLVSSVTSERIESRGQRLQASSMLSSAKLGAHNFF